MTPRRSTLKAKMYNYFPRPIGVVVWFISAPVAKIGMHIYKYKKKQKKSLIKKIINYDKRKYSFRRIDS